MLSLKSSMESFLTPDHWGEGRGYVGGCRLDWVSAVVNLKHWHQCISESKSAGPYICHPVEINEINCLRCDDK